MRPLKFNTDNQKNKTFHLINDFPNKYIILMYIMYVYCILFNMIVIYLLYFTYA
jgi:hypothetical protein